jgi:pectinesterase
MFPDKEKTTLYAEYENSGAGAITKERVNWSRQLTKPETLQYTITNILGGNDHWDPLHVQ